MQDAKPFTVCVLSSSLALWGPSNNVQVLDGTPPASIRECPDRRQWPHSPAQCSRYLLVGLLSCQSTHFCFVLPVRTQTWLHTTNFLAKQAREMPSVVRSELLPHSVGSIREWYVMCINMYATPRAYIDMLCSC